MEIISNNFRQNLPVMGTSRNILVCLSPFQSSPSLHVLETRSLQHSSQCSPAAMAWSPVCISSIQSDHPDTIKSQKRKSLCDSNHSGLELSAMVCNAAANVDKKSFSSSISCRPIEGSNAQTPHTVTQPISKISGLAHFRQHLISEGISERASKLISGSRRDSTISTYESPWRKWVSWCSEQKVDPIQCSLNEVLDYLAKLFEDGLAYSSIGVCRSALSAYHDPIDGFRLGEHPKVSALLAGIYNKRPPQPRYTFIWDVDTLLRYLKSLPGDQSLSDRLLTFKLTSLLALTSAGRAS